MSRPTAQRLANVAAVVALVGLLLIIWSVASPTPLAVIFAMTVGQIVGTASLVLLVAAVVVDLRRARLLPSRARK